MKELEAGIFSYPTKDRDGYVIRSNRKFVLDELFKQYPEILFANKTEETLLSFTLVAGYSGGWGGMIYSTCATSIVSYLFERGAGIGCGMLMPEFDFSAIRPQLFLGAHGAFLSKNQFALKAHIFRVKDVFRLISQNQLKEEDIARLYLQAEQGLQFGQFEEELKAELEAIKGCLTVCKMFNLTQLKSYAAFNVELLTVLLQVMKQQAELGFPREMNRLILSHLTGMSVVEVEGMETELIKHYRS